MSGFTLNGATPATPISFWVGGAFSFATALYLLKRACSFNPDSQLDLRTRTFARANVLACVLQGAFHVCMAAGTSAAAPFGSSFDFTWLMYVLWIFKTPVLLVQMGWASDLTALETAIIIYFDEFMVAVGYLAQIQTSTAAIWSLFALGGIAQALVFLRLYVPYEVYEKAGSNPLYVYLCRLVFVSWNSVTLIMVLDKAGAITSDGKAIGYVFTELVSTIFFGLVIVGACDAADGSKTLAAKLATFVGAVGKGVEGREAKETPVEAIKAPPA